MQIVGLTKSKENNLVQYNIIHKDAIVNINDLDIKQISSMIINSSIESIEFLKNISSLKILIKINLRIVYSKHEDNSLYVLEKSFLELNYIDVPDNLDVNDVNLALIKNKIKVEVFTENLSSKMIDNDTLMVNYFIITNLKINPNLCIAYCISNGIFENIFTSYYDGNNLTQLTFTTEEKYNDIIWEKNSSNILFVADTPHKKYINVAESENKYTIRNNNTNINKNVNSICTYNSQEVVLSLKEEDKDLLYLYNTKQNKLKEFKYTSKGISENYTKPYFSDKNNSLFCLCEINKLKCLCSISKNNNINILFNLENVEDYILNENSNKVLIKVLKNDNRYFYIMDIESRNLDFVNFDFEYDEIIKIKYLQDKSLNEVLYVLYLYEDKHYLCKHYINRSSSDLIYEDGSIIDFDINNKNLDVFIVTSNNIFSKVIRIDKNEEKEILKVPSTIKSIILK